MDTSKLAAGVLAAPPHTRSIRLLCLLPFAPRLDATDGGSRVMAQLLLGLASQHRVAVLYLHTPGQPDIEASLASRCELVEEISMPGARPMGPWLRKAQVFAAVLGGQPLWVGDMAVPAFAERLRVLAQKWQPDIVQFEYHLMGQYAVSLQQCRAPRVLNQYEPGAQAALDRSRSPLRQGRWLPALDALAWRRYERWLVRQVQAVVVFTERDRDVTRQLSRRAHIVRIPIGEDIAEQALNPVGGPAPNLLFVGNFAHVPNLEAALRLVRGIMPRVQAQVADARLYLVGDRAPQLLKQLADANIVVTGRVADVLPYLDQATVVVVPLHTGGGMRVKVMNALAAGKAVIASRLAVEGLEVSDGQQFILAETDDQFSEAIVRLLGDPLERRALAERARAWACSHLGWEASLQAYQQLYTSLLAQAQQ